MAIRLRALETTKEDIIRVAEKYIMSQIQAKQTSRAVFGSQSVDSAEMEKDGWSVHNPIDFVSFDYFKQ